MRTLKELVEQRAQLDREIAQAQAAARTESLARIQELMDQAGLTASDLLAHLERNAPKTNRAKAPPGGERAKLAAKFRNAATGETWSGRGLQPKWLRAALATGKKLEDFAV